LARYPVRLGNRKEAAHEQNKSRAHEYQAVDAHLCCAQTGWFARGQWSFCQDWFGKKK